MMDKLHNQASTRTGVIAGQRALSYKSKMKNILICIIFLSFTSIAYSGDDASGPISYSVDLSAKYTKHKLSKNDREWSKSLVENFKYKGKVVHFVKTSIPLNVDGIKIDGSIYKAIEIEGVFYVVNGDTIIDITKKMPYSPGVGGFSMHSPKSRNFIVSLNFNRRGVPHLSSTPVKIGYVTWKGDEWKRIK